MVLSRGTKEWTTGELAILRANASLGAVALAEILERGVTSVRRAAYRHRISLRRPGSRRGLVLGQPRGVSLRADVADALRAGGSLARAIAERQRLDAAAALCPSCGKRPAEVVSSGFCRRCHGDRLNEHHLLALEDLDVDRSLAASRQAKMRAIHRHTAELEP